MKEIEIFVCRICGNVVVRLNDGGTSMVCCGKKMERLQAISDAFMDDKLLEKHLPVVNLVEDKVTVQVGSLPHVMVDSHFIEWVLLHVRTGFQMHYFKVEDFPYYEFLVNGEDTPIAVYAYCNIHGLWVTKIV